MTISMQRDMRVTAISRIWAYATVMLLMSSVLHVQGRTWEGLFLPSIIVFGATTSTVVVLRKLRDQHHETLFPPNKLEELQQRIENLEAIAAIDAKAWDDFPNQLNKSTRDRL